MNKQEIITWLSNNLEKTDQEIEKFLFSEINGSEFKNKESWHKHYFLEELKSPANGFPKKVLKIINDIQKEINSVPMWKRYIAFCIDFIVLGLLYIIPQALSINPESLTGVIILLLLYFFYFSLSIYKYQTTIGLYIFKIRIDFDEKDHLLPRIIAREIIFLSLLTGIGFICYLIYGPYWDRITGTRIVWIK